jgi:WhiB family redox-sensing transcriptional regulator
MSEYYFRTMENQSRKATVDYWGWRGEAACRSLDTDLFYHPEGERGAAKANRDSAAKEVCSKCMARIACLEYALATRETYGVWGGTTEDEREEMLAGARVLNEA